MRPLRRSICAFITHSLDLAPLVFLLLPSHAVHAHRDCIWLWVSIGHGLRTRDAFIRADPHALGHCDPQRRVRDRDRDRDGDSHSDRLCDGNA